MTTVDRLIELEAVPFRCTPVPSSVRRSFGTLARNASTDGSLQYPAASSALNFCGAKHHADMQPVEPSADVLIFDGPAVSANGFSGALLALTTSRIDPVLRELGLIQCRIES